MLSNDKRIRIMIGHYGSGKSEFAMNYVTKLREWMFEHVYLDPVTKAEEKKARNIVESLFQYYTEKLQS